MPKKFHNVKSAHLEKCLVSKLGEGNVQILSRVDKPGCQEGENYDFVITCHCLMAKMGESDRKCEFVSKCLAFEEEKMKLLLRDFKVELFMYEKVFPELAEIRGRFGLNPLNVPLCYFTSIEDQVIIMENMKELGYSMRKAKAEPLTCTEVKSAFETLAKLHSTSAKLMQISNWDELSANLQSQGWISAHPEFSGMIDVFFKGAFSMAGISEFKPTKDLIEELKKIEVNGSFQAIILDDFWYNNVLFQGEAKALILDFQHCKIGNPVNDLVHFMATSVGSLVRREKGHFLLQHYYNTLKRECGIFGLELGTFDQLLKDYKSAFPLGFLYGIMQAHTDHIGKSEGIDWNLCFGGLTAEMEAKLLQSMASKSKTDLLYKNRVLDLVQDFQN